MDIKGNRHRRTIGGGGGRGKNSGKSGREAGQKR